jgi:hypothetical protein
MQDKRKLERNHTNAYFAVTNADNGKPIGSIGNMTIDGIMIISRISFADGQVIKLQIDWPESIKGCRQLIIDGECRWCQHSEEHNLYFLGFQFQKVSTTIREIIYALIDSPYFKQGVKPNKCQTLRL